MKQYPVNSPLISIFRTNVVKDGDYLVFKDEDGYQCRIYNGYWYYQRAIAKIKDEDFFILKIEENTIFKMPCIDYNFSFSLSLNWTVVNLEELEKIQDLFFVPNRTIRELLTGVYQVWEDKKV